MMNELEGCSLFDVLKKLEQSKIGHQTAMDWLNIDSIEQLVETMHANGRLMPGHQPMRISAGTRELVRSISRVPPSR